MVYTIRNRPLVVTFFMLTIVASLCLFFSPGVWAAVNATSGTSAKGVSLEGAFTGLADDASAVFYNPAGLVQLKGTHVEFGSTFIFPTIEYKDTSSNTHTSDKAFVAPYLYLSNDALRPFILAFGAYNAFARDASFVPGPGGFNARRAKIVRTDFSPVVAYEITPKLSVGVGPILSLTEMDGEATRQVGLHVEEADGWGYSGLAGIMYRHNEYIQGGVTYRARQTVRLEGDGSVAGTRDKFVLHWNYPSTISGGIAVKPMKDLTLTFNLDWVEWSRFHHLTRDFNTIADITDLSELNNIWEPRMGAEYMLNENIALRAGYLYNYETGPSKNITPTAPDLTVHQLALGTAVTYGSFDMIATYELGVGSERKVGDSAAGLNGDFNLTAHLFMISGSYEF